MIPNANYYDNVTDPPDTQNIDGYDDGFRRDDNMIFDIERDMEYPLDLSYKHDEIIPRRSRLVSADAIEDNHF